jgi:alpha-mannosidase
VDSDALVLRLYEAHGGRGTARLRVGIPFASARLANGLEEPADPLALEDGAIVLPYRPRELLTVLVS